MTVWCQQHDPLTLAPASARNYEMPAQTSSESAEIVLVLLRLPQPDPRVVASVHAACSWFEKTRIVGKTFIDSGGDGKRLVDTPGAGPIWSRYYEIGTDRPVYGDRDKSIHDDVNEISRERRKGYAWFSDKPKRVLQHYARWAKAHPQP
jgi:PelA/Pel-15E family pectate lyase